MDMEPRIPPFIGYFDVSNSSFAWRDPRPQQIEHRRAALGDVLIFDILLSSGGIHQPDTLYPPNDVESLLRLLNAIETSHYDALKKECLIYFLLKWHQDGREEKFQLDRCIPPQFAALADAYWHLDTGINVPRAVSILSDARLNRDYTSKILQAISLAPHPNPLIINYVRTAKPLLVEPDDIDVYTLALADSSLLDAWRFQRTFSETNPTRSRLLKKILEWCISPNPRSGPLTVLLGLPLTHYEEDLMHTYALEPPLSLAPSALAILRDLICVRLIQSGKYADAIKLDRQFSSLTINEAKSYSQGRKQMIQDLHAALPPAERSLLDIEIEALTQGAPTVVLSQKKIYTLPSVGGDSNTLSQSWEDIQRPLQSAPNGHASGTPSQFRRDSRATPVIPISERSGAPRFGGPTLLNSPASSPAPTIPISSSNATIVNRSVPRKSFPLPSLPPSSSILKLPPRHTSRQSLGHMAMPEKSLLRPSGSDGATTSSDRGLTYSVTNSSAVVGPHASTSGTQAFDSAVRKQNAFYHPPPPVSTTRANGVKKSYDDNGEASPGNTMDTSKEDELQPTVRSGDMEVEEVIDVRGQASETGILAEEKEAGGEEHGLEYSVFSSDATQTRGPGRGVVTGMAKGRRIRTRGKEQEKAGRRVPPGAFISDEEDEGEVGPDTETWEAQSRRSRPIPKTTVVTESQSVKPRRGKDADLGRSLPGSLMDDEGEGEDREDDYVAPLRAPSPQRRPIRKARSSVYSDDGEDGGGGMHTRRRSSRLSTVMHNGHKVSPEPPSPKKVSSTKGRKSSSTAKAKAGATRKKR